MGYEPQNPPANSDGLTAFYYAFSLPLYLYAVAILVTVGKVLDPQFVVHYIEVLREAITLLKAKHDQILSGLVQLVSTDWTSLGLLKTACPPRPPSHGGLPGTPWKPAAGIRFYDGLPITGPPKKAIIEYGAVERFSGYSSVGYRYTIPLTVGPANTDLRAYAKLRTRLLKRTKDVYVGVGLETVRRAIKKLGAIVGEPVMAGPGLADWSLLEVAALFKAGGMVDTRSLRQLAYAIVSTDPLDTPSGSGSSLRALLTDFPD